MSTATSRELIEAALASVEARVQAQIEAARQRREHDRQQRAELAAARKRGLGKRHAQKLRNQTAKNFLGSQENPGHPDDPDSGSGGTGLRPNRTQVRVHARGDLDG